MIILARGLMSQYNILSWCLTQMKLASVKLAKLYMKRVSMEIESRGILEKESTQEALLLQSVRFAYRAHQVIQAFCSLS